MSLGRYSILVVCVALASLALAWPLALRQAAGEVRLAVLFGGAVAVLNTVAAHALVVWSAGRSTTAFLRAVLGGMAGRMALMLAALATGILALGLPRLPLSVSLLSGFALFLVMELVIVHRQGASPASPR